MCMTKSELDKAIEELRGLKALKEETEQDLRPALPDVTWEETRNLASLVVR